jgi:hypothetical protein
MKGNYKKPTLNVEYFTLTQTFARDCGSGGADFGDPSDCAWDLGDGTLVFIVGNNCQIDGGDAEFGCYNNPGEGNYSFRS